MLHNRETNDLRVSVYAISKLNGNWWRVCNLKWQKKPVRSVGLKSKLVEELTLDCK